MIEYMEGRRERMPNQINRNSKVKEVYENPIGHDIISKILLQLNKKEILIKNPLIGNMKLHTLALLTRKTLGEAFFQTLIDLLNNEPDRPGKNLGTISRAWWKEAVFYQIYPRSFMDSNGDGIGDLSGIISKLDYLKELGIDAIWLSPIYDSPCDDNGYDIRDYYNILKEFGTMEEFTELLVQIHKRGMKLIMDLVVNHTSDEHPWFAHALNHPESKYRDYYILDKSKDGNPPNNWTSFFSGSAWNYYEKPDLWGLHLFSKKQMDLNWENEGMRKEIHKMIRWWLEQGVDGFRMDVINYISKKEGLPDGNEIIGKMMGYCGIEHYFYGPKLHEYLRELKQEAFAPFDAFTVGETPGVGIEMAKLLTAEERKELDMVFSFDHLETPGHVRYDDYEYDLNYYKEYIIHCIESYGDRCWMSLFYENHDNPRMISKVNSNPEYRKPLAKLLAMLQMTLKGTPFLYQGQEIGAVNQKFQSMEELRDVESINLYQDLSKTMEEDAAFRRVLAGSRDHARTPMQWEEAEHAGFTSGTPWIMMDEDYREWNVRNQLQEEHSVLQFYKKLIRIRKESMALIYGELEVLHRKKKDHFLYLRRQGSESWLVECNLSSKMLVREKTSIGKGTLILSNYQGTESELRPYEANLYLICDKPE